MTKENAAILAGWKSSFPGIPPIGFKLRASLPERWVRFHSLPGAKRYPENEAEYREVLELHNTILGELAHPGETVILITVGYSDSNVPMRDCPVLVDMDPEAKPWLSIKADDGEDVEEDSSYYWHFFASAWDYWPGMFEPFVRLVADDVIDNLIILASDHRWLVLPYDGGMDVIAESTESRQQLRSKHAKWLSMRSDGM